MGNARSVTSTWQLDSDVVSRMQVIIPGPRRSALMLSSVYIQYQGFKFNSERSTSNIQYLNRRAVSIPYKNFLQSLSLNHCSTKHIPQVLYSANVSAWLWRVCLLHHVPCSNFLPSGYSLFLPLFLQMFSTPAALRDICPCQPQLQRVFISFIVTFCQSSGDVRRGIVWKIH